MLVLAHGGHWLVQAVYFLPVVAFLVWLGITQLRARREENAPVSDSGRDRKR